MCRDYFPRKHRTSLVFEYVMLEGVNDGLEHAAELHRLLADVPCKINLIPSILFPTQVFRAPNPKRSKPSNAFSKQRLVDHRAKTRGQVLTRLCGQLAGQVLDRTRRKHGNPYPSDNCRPKNFRAEGFLVWKSKDHLHRCAFNGMTKQLSSHTFHSLSAEG